MLVSFAVLYAEDTAARFWYDSIDIYILRGKFAGILYLYIFCICFVFNLFCGVLICVDLFYRGIDSGNWNWN